MAAIETSPGPVIQTPLGPVRGREQDGVARFLGIPYAAPPVGGLRFAPPAPAEPWSAVRDATAFGPAPIQPSDGLSQQLGLLGDHPQSEDCLTLNVFAPATPAREPRPVMVWLHGGAFQTGTAAGPGYDGSPLALRGDVVVVTLNYRVGALGFLHTNAPGAANLGLQDQCAALRFVRDAIAGFGGDPACVTVFGESAGAGSIVCLLAMPMARDLFQRAIVQSAAPEGQLSLEEARARAALFAEPLGAADLDALRALPAERLLEAQAACVEPGPRRIGMFFAPVVDGEVLPQTPLTAVANGAARDVDLVIGTTADEMRLFTLVPGFGEIPEAALPALVATRLPGPPETSLARAEKLLTLYPEAGSAVERFFAVETDASLFAPSTRLAEAQARHRARTFMYRFTWRSPFGTGSLGACHALDVPFALGTLGRPKLADFAGRGPAAERVAAAMMDAWSAFARHGDPSHPGIPAWPPYAPPERATLEIGDPCRVVAAPCEAQRRAFSETT